MQAVEDDGAVPRPLLPRCESRQIGWMVMGSGRGGLVDQPHPPLLQPITDLDIFPRRVGEAEVEGLGEEQVARHRQVRGVEEVEGHVLPVADQGVAELEAVLVDVAQEGI